MKKLFLATVAFAALGSTALAADLGRAYTKAPPPPAPIFTWTGFYIGAHVGYGWANKDWAFPAIAPFLSHDPDGFIGGGQLGFNYQVGQWVFGLEGDVSYSDMNATSPCLLAPISCRSKLDWVATATARLGYTWDRTLLYVKGGGAFADENYRVSAPIPVLFLPVATTASETRTGWTVGVGIEHALTNNWSVKLEYNYLDFGTERLRFSDGSLVDIDQQVSLIKFGVNYRF